MLSDVAICNRALRLLRVQPITAFEDPGEAAAWCAGSYAQLRDALIAEYPWNFAQRRAVLPAETAAPAWGPRWSYALPAEPDWCLRVLSIEGEPLLPVSYRIEGRSLLSDCPPPLRLLYLARVEDATRFPPLFAEALAARLAAEGAFHFTGSTAREAQLAELAERKAALARRFDAQEGTAGALVAVDWLEARL